jgi:small-conductance mechanosensitive channel
MNIMNIKDKIISVIPRIIIFLIILKLTTICANYARHLSINMSQTKSSGRKLNFEEKPNKVNMIYYQFGNIIYYFVNIIGLIIAIINLGVQVSTVLTVFGTLALGIGLSMQGTLINIITGIYIAINDIFAVGDVINFQDKIGKVVEMTLLNTVLVNNDKKEGGNIYIPNNLFQSNLVKNLSR